MRIAGYVRQTPGRTDPDTAFAQSERIRRWVADTSNELIAVCQDHHAASAPSDRPGFKALLDIARSQDADAVVVASLSALSPDKMTQEIMIQDLASAGATLIATDEADIAALQGADDDHARMLVRDILARFAEYIEAFGLSGEVEPSVQASAITPIAPNPKETTDVVVELIVPRAQPAD
ncbi:MAG: recombinase family protein [Acidimicrobiia bacterium]